MKVYKTNNGKKKISAFVICLLLTVVIGISGTLAYLFTQTSPVTNTFNPAAAPNEIKETMANNVKSNVFVSIPSITENPKAVKVYVRAAMVVTWQDGEGNIAPIVPIEGTDYIVTMPENSKWHKHVDSYYYYKEIVEPGECTENLFDSITVVEGKTPEGYALSVELLSQSIQAEGVNKDGVTPIALAWGITISNEGYVENVINTRGGQ